MRTRVFLCGGTHSGWQDRVKEANLRFSYIDPRAYAHINSPALYTPINLGNIARCDIVFANLEESNPGGQNSLLELGFALALGKRIVLVCDYLKRWPYVQQAVSACNEFFGALDRALEWWSMQHECGESA